jgi:hypothetical protein
MYNTKGTSTFAFPSSLYLLSQTKAHVIITVRLCWVQHETHEQGLPGGVDL